MGETPRQVEGEPKDKQERIERILSILRAARGEREDHEDAKPVSITQPQKDGSPITHDGCFVYDITEAGGKNYAALDVNGDYVEILITEDVRVEFAEQNKE